MKLFIIDDDEIFVLLTKKIIELTKIETEISEFEDGESAITHLKKIISHKDLLPDIILLDLSMPIMDGWSFLEEYMKLYLGLDKKINLFILTSSISPHDIERAKNIPAVSDFIIKPLTKDKFSQIISSVTI